MFNLFSKKYSNVSAEKANELISENKELVILDVRTKEEYQNGHIKGAKLFPVQTLAGRISELKKFQGHPILVYCASGGRSPSALKYLIDNDFKEIYHLNRGISSWTYKLSR